VENAAGMFLVQLLQQSPLLLAYVIAILLALTNWRRCPTSCLLTLVAAGLLLTISALQTFFNVYLIQNRAGMEGRADQLHSVLTTVAIGSGLFRALAFGLLLAAVFHGRSEADLREPDHPETLP
jgi:hypothetical protein